MIPLPFARAALIYGEPIIIPADAKSEEEQRLWAERVGAAIDALEAEAERGRCGCGEGGAAGKGRHGVGPSRVLAARGHGRRRARADARRPARLRRRLRRAVRRGLEAYLGLERVGLRRRERLPVPVVSIGNLTSAGPARRR